MTGGFGSRGVGLSPGCGQPEFSSDIDGKIFEAGRSVVLESAGVPVCLLGV